MGNIDFQRLDPPWVEKILRDKYSVRRRGRRAVRGEETKRRWLICKMYEGEAAAFDKTADKS